jgi:hypothetical protein
MQQKHLEMLRCRKHIAIKLMQRGWPAGSEIED